MAASSTRTRPRPKAAGSSGSSEPKPEKLYGFEEPRIYTPPLRELTPETTLGFAVIAFATEMLLIELLPWQKWLLVHMLELREDGSLRFRKVVVLVARQNGKSTLSIVLALWFMYCYGLRLVLGTAQDLDTAEEVWQAAVDLVTEEDEDEEPVRPELSELVTDVVRVNGKKALVVGGKGTGKSKRRYKVKAANRRAGRGLSGDLIMLDELREHQSWDAWASITKTTIARAFALILAMSNAGDSTSIVLRHLRKLAHAMPGDPDGIIAREQDNVADTPAETAPTDEELAEFEPAARELLEQDDTLGLFEWSAPPGCDVRDRQGWAQANPSLGYTIQESTLASDAATDPEWVFRTECLCQWPDGTLTGPFPTMTWDAGRWDEHGDKPRIIGKVRACVTMSHDRTLTTMAYAGRRADGLPHVEIVAQRAGTEWVRGWFSDPDRGAERRARVEVVIGRKSGPEAELLKDLRDDGLTVFEWAGADLPAWTGEFYDLVASTQTDQSGVLVEGLSHMPQPALDIAAGTALTRPSGLRFVWDDARSSAMGVDICTLVAATGAVGHLITQRPPTPPPSPRRAASPAAPPGLGGRTVGGGLGLPPLPRGGPPRPSW